MVHSSKIYLGITKSLLDFHIPYIRIQFTNSTHRLWHITAKDVALIKPTPFVFHIQTETIQQRLGVATGTEQNQLDGMRGHGLVRLGVL